MREGRGSHEYMVGPVDEKGELDESRAAIMESGKTKEEHNERVVGPVDEQGGLDTSRAAIMEVTKPGQEKRTFVNPIERTGEDGQVSAHESSSDVLISNKQPINGSEEESKGGFGTAYSVDVQLPGSDKAYPFVLKEAHDFMDDKRKEQVVLDSVRNHRMGKRAKLKVWNTYRTAEDKKSILMSIGHAEGWKLIGDRNKMSDKEKTDFLPISDFESF